MTTNNYFQPMVYDNFTLNIDLLVFCNDSLVKSIPLLCHQFLKAAKVSNLSKYSQLIKSINIFKQKHKLSKLLRRDTDLDCCNDDVKDIQTKYQEMFPEYFNENAVEIEVFQDTPNKNECNKIKLKADFNDGTAILKNIEDFEVLELITSEAQEFYINSLDLSEDSYNEYVNI